MALGQVPLGIGGGEDGRHQQTGAERDTAGDQRFNCPDRDLLYEEHPDAYKAIEPVIGALVDAGLATPIAELVPVVTVKR